jgi:hypothetical protein
MRKAGRPRKNGLQPIWVPQRVTLALFAYERARELGEKHSVAVTEAVKYIRQTAPRMRISETEVKRIVAYWRPKGSTKCIRVTEPGRSGNILSVPVLPIIAQNHTFLKRGELGEHPLALARTMVFTKYRRAGAARNHQETSAFSSNLVHSFFQSVSATNSSKISCNR